MNAKRYIITGCYGASFGAVLGIAIWSLTLLLTITPKNNLGIGADGYAKANNQLARIRAKSLYDQAVAIDPYYIEASKNKGLIGVDPYYIDTTRVYRLTKPNSDKIAGIIFGQIQADHRDTAKKTFDLIENVDTRWDVLFLLEQKIRGLIEKGDDLAKETIDFIHSNIPSPDDEIKRDLMIILGQSYHLLGNKEKAMLAFKEAANLYFIVEKNKKSDLDKATPDSDKFKSVVSEYVSRGEKKIFQTGKIILFPVVFGSFGFILSIILRPALEAFGRAVLAPSIAKILRSEEMMAELEKKESVK